MCSLCTTPKVGGPQVQYFVEICGFAICGLILKICGFAERNEPKNLRICLTAFVLHIQQTNISSFFKISYRLGVVPFCVENSQRLCFKLYDWLSGKRAKEAHVNYNKIVKFYANLKTVQNVANVISQIKYIPVCILFAA